MVPNGLAFSCRERTAQDHAKKAPISRAEAVGCNSGLGGSRSMASSSASHG